MKLKANLHMHTSDDPCDIIGYSLHEAVDRAHEHGFDVLALTCHAKWAWTDEYARYAESKGILLIPGIELALDGRTRCRGVHVVVLGGDRSLDDVQTIGELRAYKKKHPDIFIFAPHPFYSAPLKRVSLMEKLEKNIDLFDAIEWSWFYSKTFVQKQNQRAKKIAEKHNLPLIATSDTHFLDYLKYGHTVIDAEGKNVPAIFDALREGRIENVSEPRKFWREMIKDYMLKKIVLGDVFKKTFRKT